jgi:hypothetical protein
MVLLRCADHFLEFGSIRPISEAPVVRRVHGWRQALYGETVAQGRCVGFWSDQVKAVYALYI